MKYQHRERIPHANSATTCGARGARAHRLVAPVDLLARYGRAQSGRTYAAMRRGGVSEPPIVPIEATAAPCSSCAITGS